MNQTRGKNNRKLIPAEDRDPQKKGELWYVRAVPPPASFISYWVGIVKPHVLCAPLKSDWVAFFERNNIRSGEDEQRMDNFLKFGPQPLYEG